MKTEAYDPEGAKEVLEKAGWVDTDGNGIREKEGQDLNIRWLTYPSRQELPLLAESAQATLKEIGMNVEINGTCRPQQHTGRFFCLGRICQRYGNSAYRRSGIFLYYPLSGQFCGKQRTLSQRQAGGTGSSEMAKTFDTERRSELAVAMQQTILDDYGFVFCSHLKMSMISKSTVTGLTAHPCDFYEITVDLAPAS